MIILYTIQSYPPQNRHGGQTFLQGGGKKGGGPRRALFHESKDPRCSGHQLGHRCPPPGAAGQITLPARGGFGVTAAKIVRGGQNFFTGGVRGGRRRKLY